MRNALFWYWYQHQLNTGCLFDVSSFVPPLYGCQRIESTMTRNKGDQLDNSDDIGSFLPEASFGLRVLSLPASVCVCVCVCGNHLLVRAITCHPFKLESPNLDQKSKTPWGNWPWTSRSNLTSKWKITIFWACPCHHSPPIQDKISKFGPKIHLSTLKIPENFGLDWHCPSISFLISKPILYQPEKMLFASFLLYILEWEHRFQVTPHMLLVWVDL